MSPLSIEEETTTTLITTTTITTMHVPGIAQKKLCVRACVCQGRVNTQSHNLVHSLGKVSVFSGVDVKFQPDDFASQLLPLFEEELWTR